jgi:hypothetical protein
VCVCVCVGGGGWVCLCVVGACVRASSLSGCYILKRSELTRHVFIFLPDI